MIDLLPFQPEKKKSIPENTHGAKRIKYILQIRRKVHCEVLASSQVSLVCVH